MARAPFQILVFPFVISASSQNIAYAVFRRSDSTDACWQGIAGGGEIGEDAEAAARREAQEEAGITAISRWIPLDSTATIPVVNISGFLWGPDVLVIPEYTFGAQIRSLTLHLSPEHLEYRWVCYEKAQSLLTWDSNKNALWELNSRLTRMAA